MERRTLTIEETAEVLGVGRSTLYDRLHGEEIRLGSRTLKVIRIGARVVVPVAQLEDVLGERAS